MLMRDECCYVDMGVPYRIKPCKSKVNVFLPYISKGKVMVVCKALVKSWIMRDKSKVLSSLS